MPIDKCSGTSYFLHKEDHLDNSNTLKVPHKKRSTFLPDQMLPGLRRKWHMAEHSSRPTVLLFRIIPLTTTMQYGEDSTIRQKREQKNPNENASVTLFHSTKCNEAYGQRDTVAEHSSVTSHCSFVLDGTVDNDHV